MDSDFHGTPEFCNPECTHVYSPIRWSSADAVKFEQRCGIDHLQGAENNIKLWANVPSLRGIQYVAAFQTCMRRISQKSRGNTSIGASTLAFEHCVSRKCTAFDVGRKAIGYCQTCRLIDRSPSSTALFDHRGSGCLMPCRRGFLIWLTSA